MMKKFKFQNLIYIVPTLISILVWINEKVWLFVDVLLIIGLFCIATMFLKGQSFYRTKMKNLTDTNAQLFSSELEKSTTFFLGINYLSIFLLVVLVPQILSMKNLFIFYQKTSFFTLKIVNISLFILIPLASILPNKVLGYLVTLSVSCNHLAKEEKIDDKFLGEAYAYQKILSLILKIFPIVLILGYVYYYFKK